MENNTDKHIDELIEAEVYSIHGDHPELSESQLDDIRKRSKELISILGLSELRQGWVDVKGYNLDKFQQEYSNPTWRLPEYNSMQNECTEVKKKKSIWNRIDWTDARFWIGIAIFVVGACTAIHLVFHNHGEAGLYAFIGSSVAAIALCR